MTTVNLTRPARARDVLAAEWIKLRSVRSTPLTLLFAALAAVGIGYLVTHSDVTHWPTMTAAARAAFDPVSDSFTGLGLAQLAFGVIGVLAISSEYATGLIRTTFGAVPRRRAVLAAKAAVIGVVTLVAGELIAFATFFTVMAWVGLGLGALVRHTAGAITAMTAVVFLLPTIIHALPAPWDTRIGRFTLDGAAQQMIAQHPHAGYFSAVGSSLVVAAYAVAAIASAALVITRRDA